MDEIRQILKEIEEMHPYRIQGIRESYDKYAEGWTDAVNEIESRLPVAPDTNIGNMSEFPNSSTLQPTCSQLATDCIDRRAAIDILYDFAGCIVDTPNGDYQKAYQAYRHRLEILPSAQPERTCVNCGRTANNGGWYADGRTRCPIEEHYALPKDGYCHLWEKRNITDDDYPERRTDD